jgi:hypothetical protein
MRRIQLLFLLGLTGWLWTGPLRAQQRPEDEVTNPWVITGEAVGYWVRSSRVVPLVTTGSGPNAGGLADPNTTILFDSSRLDFNPSIGGRVQLAYAFCPGITATLGGFVVDNERRQTTFASDATGNPFLFRPFFNVETNNPNAGVIVAAPGVLAGSIQISTTRQIYGANSDLICPIYGDEDWQLSGCVGGCYLSLKEALQINDSTTSLVGGVLEFAGAFLPTGSVVTSMDRFDAHNQFFGSEIGLILEARLSQKFWAGLDLKLGLGDNHAEIAVVGLSTAMTPGGTTAILPAGTLALPSNSGMFTRDRFGAIPQVDLQIGYDITSSLRAILGYQLIVWPGVARASELAPARISDVALPTSPAFGTVAQFPGVPPVLFPSSTFWIQGVHGGLEYRF